MMIMLMFDDNYDDDYVDNDMVMTLVWIMICWFYGRKYLMMQLVVN